MRFQKQQCVPQFFCLFITGMFLCALCRIRDTDFKLCHVCRKALDESLLDVNVKADVATGGCVYACSRESVVEFGLMAAPQAHEASLPPEMSTAHALCYKRQMYSYLLAQQTSSPAMQNDHEMQQKRQQFHRRLSSSAQMVSVYEKPDQQAVALKCIDYEKVRGYMGARMEGGASEPVDVAFVKALLHWFKRDHFKWVNIICTHCRDESVAAGSNYVKRVENMGVTDQILPEERAGWPGRVEIYKCSDCKRTIRFPRNNNPGHLLSAAPTGRCGEFANAWGLLCRALSLDIIYALDFTDHVWIEVYIPSYSRYVHTDPCENAFDRPLLYEKGWGKKLTYVVGLNRAGCHDLTPKYTRHFAECVARRQQGHVVEVFGREVIVGMDQQLEEHFAQKLRLSTRLVVPHPALGAVLPIYHGLLSMGEAGFQTLAEYSPNNDQTEDVAVAKGILSHKRHLGMELAGVLLMSEAEETLLQDTLFPVPVPPVALEVFSSPKMSTILNGHTTATVKTYVGTLDAGVDIGADGTLIEATGCSVGDVGDGGRECIANLLLLDESKWCLCGITADMCLQEKVWVSYAFPCAGGVKLAHYTLTSANDSPDRNPMAWAILGQRCTEPFKDAPTQWEVLHEVSLSADPFHGRFHHTLHFSIDERYRGQSYSAVKLVIRRNGGDGEVQLSQWLFYSAEGGGDNSGGVGSHPSLRTAAPPEAYGGRVSGDDAWKRARGESGKPVQPPSVAVAVAGSGELLTAASSSLSCLVAGGGGGAISTGCATEHELPEAGNAITSIGVGGSATVVTMSECAAVVEDAGVSATDLEQVDQLIQTISRYRVGGDGGAALKLLNTFLNNVATSPAELKFRSINAESNAFKSKFLPLVGPVQLLKLVGFVKSPSEEKYILESANLPLLQITCTKLQVAIEAYGGQGSS